jgi:hypothetical protein
VSPNVPDDEMSEQFTQPLERIPVTPPTPKVLGAEFRRQARRELLEELIADADERDKFARSKGIYDEIEWCDVAEWLRSKPETES